MERKEGAEEERAGGSLILSEVSTSTTFSLHPLRSPARSFLLPFFFHVWMTFFDILMSVCRACSFLSPPAHMVALFHS